MALVLSVNAGGNRTSITKFDVGEITGFYVDASGVGHGFLRTLGGTITTFEAPGAGTAAGQGTFGVGLTLNLGAITGEYIDGGNVVHGFRVEGL